MKKWKDRLLWLGKILWSLAPDIFAVSGAALITWGVWDIYPPAALITSGVLCIVAAILVSRGGGGG